MLTDHVQAGCRCVAPVIERHVLGCQDEDIGESGQRFLVCGAVPAGFENLRTSERQTTIPDAFLEILSDSVERGFFFEVNEIDPRVSRNIGDGFPSSRNLVEIHLRMGGNVQYPVVGCQDHRVALAQRTGKPTNLRIQILEFLKPAVGCDALGMPNLVKLWHTYR